MDKILKVKKRPKSGVYIQIPKADVKQIEKSLIEQLRYKLAGRRFSLGDTLVITMTVKI